MNSRTWGQIRRLSRWGGAVIAAASCVVLAMTQSGTASPTAPATRPAVRPASMVTLPLLEVRATGAFDERDRAPANKAFRLDLTPGVTSGATGSPITDVTIQYSTDGGKTWHDATITRGTGGVWHAVVHDPASGFVSLRIGVYDKAGSSLQETIYRAYGVN